MGDKTAWADATWNPIRGTTGRWSCVKISPGCANCYAERLNVRFGGPRYIVGADILRLDEEVLAQPLRWRRPRRIFVCSMTDLFEERVNEKWIYAIFDVMAQAQWHTFLVFTKRSDRLEDFCGRVHFIHDPRPLPNVWLGISAENQQYADERIPWLLQTPAAVRSLSLEPLLGAIDLSRWLPIAPRGDGWERVKCEAAYGERRARISWVIAGGESGGPPERALVYPEPLRGVVPKEYHVKPEARQWVRSIRDQCVAAGVPFFFKQWGGPTPKSGGRLLDGREWNEYPRSR